MVDLLGRTSFLVSGDYCCWSAINNARPRISTDDDLKSGARGASGVW